MLPLLLCFKLEKLCSSKRKFAELDRNTSAGERERIRIDFWDWIVQSHGIPALNDDEIELKANTTTRKRNLTLVTLPRFSISGEISAEKMYAEN